MTHLSSSRSDHKALALNLSGGTGMMKGQRSFRYEIMWERADDLAREIERAWLDKNPGSDLGCIAESLKQVTMALHTWSKSKFSHALNKLKSLRQQGEDLEADDLIQNRDRIFQIKRELDELLY